MRQLKSPKNKRKSNHRDRGDLRRKQRSSLMRKSRNRMKGRRNKKYKLMTKIKLILQLIKRIRLLRGGGEREPRRRLSLKRRLRPRSSTARRARPMLRLTPNSLSPRLTRSRRMVEDEELPPTRGSTG